MEVNAQYNVAGPNSLPVRVAAHQRRKMFVAFLDQMDVRAGDTISTWARRAIEAMTTELSRSVVSGQVGDHRGRVDDASFLESHPGVRFVRRQPGLAVYESVFRLCAFKRCA
jgi:hypothetical protein